MLWGRGKVDVIDVMGEYGEFLLVIGIVMVVFGMSESVVDVG